MRIPCWGSRHRHLHCVGKICEDVFGFIGKYSTYVWLVHTFFAYYFFQAVTFFPKYSILVFLWCLALSLLAGILLDLMLKGLSAFTKGVFDKLFRKKNEAIIEENVSLEENRESVA